MYKLWDRKGSIDFYHTACKIGSIIIWFIYENYNCFDYNSFSAKVNIFVISLLFMTAIDDSNKRTHGVYIFMLSY